MEKQSTLKRPITTFIILTNIIFFPLFLLTGITYATGHQVLGQLLVHPIAGWSSTFAFAILFKKIYPGRNFIDYVKEQFKGKLKASVVAMAIIVPTLIFVISAFILGKINNGAGTILADTSIGMMIYLFYANIINGPTGEELGWRAFALNELQKKYSPILAALIIGFWWGLWHLPTWFTNGIWGLELVKFIVIFMLTIIAMSIIITVFYNLNKNLLIPIIIHQLFNFLTLLLAGDLMLIRVITCCLYVLTAIVLIIINPKEILYKRK